MAAVDLDKYVLAKTFFWLAGIGATVTLGLALSVLAMAETQGKNNARIDALEDHEIQHPITRSDFVIDHDEQIWMKTTMNHISGRLDDIVEEMKRHHQ